MKELYVFCEGETEQNFCNQVLGPHLFPAHDGQIHTIKIAHSKHHGIIHRGGTGKYATPRWDIKSELKRRGSPDVYFTTMIDLYRSPKDIPGRDANVLDPNNPRRYVEALERAMEADIGDRRFLPHLQLYEYETLLFSNPEGLRISFDDCDEAIKEMIRIATSRPSVEHVNDGERTAPSKRIISLLPEYEGLKATAGPDIAEFIGIEVIKEKCPHFHAWITKLQGLWPPAE